MGHHVLGCELVDRISGTGFPRGSRPSLRMQVKHLILAHHGRLEYGSPKVPANHRSA
jgi:3'-5' exoribonuclease